MAYAEFPHTNYSDHDHVELILLYKKLVDEYEGTLNEIKEVSERLDKYESDMNARILQIENVTVPNAVNRAVQEAMVSYQSEVNTRFNNLNIRVSTVENMYESLSDSIEQVDASVRAEIENLRTEVIARDNNLQVQINNFNNQMSNLQQEMATFKQLVTTDMNSFKDSMENQQVEFESQVADTMLSFTDSINNMLKVYKNDYILRDNITLNDANKYTDRKVSALYDLIQSLNLASCIRDITWLWKYGCCAGGYSAIQWYNDTKISAEEWDSSVITCVEWYTVGREFFHWYDRQKMMFSPISGRMVDVRVALMELATALKIDSLTAEDYEKLGFTAEEYDNYQIKAEEYDWNGRYLNVQ